MQHASWSPMFWWVRWPIIDAWCAVVTSTHMCLRKNPNQPRDRGRKGLMAVVTGILLSSHVCRKRLLVNMVHGAFLPCFCFYLLHRAKYMTDCVILVLSCVILLWTSGGSWFHVDMQGVVVLWCCSCGWNMFALLRKRVWMYKVALFGWTYGMTSGERESSLWGRRPLYTWNVQGFLHGCLGKYLSIFGKATPFITFPYLSPKLVVSHIHYPRFMPFLEKFWMLIQSLESNSWYPRLASSLLFCHRRSWKPSAQNVAEVAAWPRSIRKRWQLLGGQWSSQCFLSWVTSFWMTIMKSWNKNMNTKKQAWDC